MAYVLPKENGVGGSDTPIYLHPDLQKIAIEILEGYKGHKEMIPMITDPCSLPRITIDSLEEPPLEYQKSIVQCSLFMENLSNYQVFISWRVAVPFNKASNSASVMIDTTR